ncbi:hypothetical protein ACU5EH_05315 [Aliivibrio salmonicida]|uniref:hypothetical protein n=1 Tax=Aliivibrio salmonicida TaxID=40269 RepID=UPI00406C0D8C
MPCNNQHLRIIDENTLTTLEHHQMHDHGRHKCCQCAYNSGYEQGIVLSENIVLDIDNLGNSQAASDGRHKSVHQAFALGYTHGIRDFINNQ